MPRPHKRDSNGNIIPRRKYVRKKPYAARISRDEQPETAPKQETVQVDIQALIDAVRQEHPLEDDVPAPKTPDNPLVNDNDELLLTEVVEEPLVKFKTRYDVDKPFAEDAPKAVQPIQTTYEGEAVTITPVNPLVPVKDDKLVTHKVDENPFSLDDLKFSSLEAPKVEKTEAQVQAEIAQVNEEARIKESTERAWKKALKLAEAEKDRIIRWRRLGRW